MVLREIIEKGSSGDINRGVKDFRQEHGERLRQMSGLVPGLPEHLAAYVRGFWEAALSAARDLHADQVRQWQAQLDDADGRVLQAESVADRARAELAAARAEVDGLHVQLDAGEKLRQALQQQIERERELRVYAEKIRDEQAADLAKQRERLEVTLAESQAETRRALERFDGERRHSLLQIEEARAKADRDVKNVRDQAIRTEAELRRQLGDAAQAASALRAQLATLGQKSAATEQERRDLQVALSRAEMQAGRLQEQNRAMVELIKNRENGPRSPAATVKRPAKTLRRSSRRKL